MVRIICGDAVAEVPHFLLQLKLSLMQSVHFEFHKICNNPFSRSVYLRLNWKLNDVWLMKFGDSSLQICGSHSFNFSKVTLLRINVQKSTEEYRKALCILARAFLLYKVCVLLFCFVLVCVCVFVFILNKNSKDGNYKERINTL